MHFRTIFIENKKEIEMRKPFSNPLTLDELKEIKVGSEMTLPIIETIVYKTAAKHLCRTSCIMPAAILKAIEVEYKLFKPVPASIEFMEEI